MLRGAGDAAMKIRWLPREYLDALYGTRENRRREVKAMHSFAFSRDIGETVCSSSSPLERPEFFKARGKLAKWTKFDEIDEASEW
jgi:hypothetical protein